MRWEVAIDRSSYDKSWGEDKDKDKNEEGYLVW